MIVTDLLMPEKEGIETIIEMRRLRPDAKIIAISGGGLLGKMNFLDPRVVRSYGRAQRSDASHGRRVDRRNQRLDLGW